MKSPHLYDDLAESRRLVKMYPVERHHQILTKLEKKERRFKKWISTVFLLFAGSLWFFPEISVWIDSLKVQVWLSFMIAVILLIVGIWCLRKTHVF